MNRRTFLASGSCLALSLACPPCPWIRNEAWAARDVTGEVFRDDAPDTLWKWSKEAFSYSRLDQGRVLCKVCPHGCVLSPGDRSVCRNKINHEGDLYTLAYGNPCSVHLDPIEKKPLFHFLPGTSAYSLATTGCNFRCRNCQNWQISQKKPSQVRHKDLLPGEALKEASESGASSVAYTYSEPIAFIEYMADLAKRARDKGLANLLISNGFINNTPLRELCPDIQAANINLKAFSDEIYRTLNGGRLEPVLETLRTLHGEGVHLEITNLVVPGYTDDREMVKGMCDWITDQLGPDCPLHFLRFIPRYKLDRLPPTPIPLLKDFRQLARNRGIRYVYIGNAPLPEGLNTYCHHCGELLVRRRGYQPPELGLESGRCPSCSTEIPGVWS